MSIGMSSKKKLLRILWDIVKNRKSVAVASTTANKVSKAFKNLREPINGLNVFYAFLYQTNVNNMLTFLSIAVGTVVEDARCCADAK